ncbi:MAG: hypothetical protein ABIG11_03390 [bacterium]
MFQKVGSAFNKWLGRLKRLFIWLGTWGFIFSVATIAGLKAGFDYDDTLAFTAPAYARVERPGLILNSPGYWKTLNQAYDLEKVKILPYITAWMLRITGFKISVVSERGSVGSDDLVKSWKPLVSEFRFVPNLKSKADILSGDNYMVYFGDSDSDILQARKAGVFPLRVKRSRKSNNRSDYRPGSLREWVIPLSEF